MKNYSSPSNSEPSVPCDTGAGAAKLTSSSDSKGAGNSGAGCHEASLPGSDPAPQAGSRGPNQAGSCGPVQAGSGDTLTGPSNSTALAGVAKLTGPSNSAGATSGVRQSSSSDSKGAGNSGAGCHEAKLTGSDPAPQAGSRAPNQAGSCGPVQAGSGDTLTGPSDSATLAGAAKLTSSSDSKGAGNSGAGCHEAKLTGSCPAPQAGSRAPNQAGSCGPVQAGSGDTLTGPSDSTALAGPASLPASGDSAGAVSGLAHKPASGSRPHTPPAPGPLSILVVDDEEKIRAVIQSYLEHAGYQVLQASNGQQALTLFRSHNPALVILDLMLPDTSGQDVCAAIRTESDSPVLMLTARVDETSVLEGFSLGADDYLTKPFSPRELVARVQALLRRRTGSIAQPRHLETQTSNNLSKSSLYSPDGLLELNRDHKTFKRNGREIKVTATEFRLLELFLANPGRVYSRDDLVSKALKEDFDGLDRTVDAHIKNLRLKIESDSRHPRYLLTVHGMGYRMAPE